MTNHTHAATIHLSDLRLRDPCILPDAATQSYILIGSSGLGVRAYTSRDLKSWMGPHTIFEAPSALPNGALIAGIWAPEMHLYRGKYFLFLTFNTRHEMGEQRPNWLPRVVRSSTIFVSDSPFGPFEPIDEGSILPLDRMTLDGTLWVEDGAPHMILCHEWVQITDGTVEAIALSDDLSATVGEPQVLFHGSEAPWNHASKQYGSYVTDGPYPFRSRSGKLFLVWSGFGDGGYNTGLAISDSGKLAGPWRQQEQPLFKEDGGHPMLFTSFEGRLMMVIHSPNHHTERPRLFEMEDTGDTLVLTREFVG